MTQTRLRAALASQMAPASENRFLTPRDRPRVAVFTSSRLPAKWDQALLARVQHLVAALDADVRFFHSAVEPDVDATPADLALLDCTMTVPGNDLIATADRDHFEQTSPELLVESLRAIESHVGDSADPALEHSLRAALSMVRYAKAWAPDLLISFHLFDGSLAASLCRAMLGSPRLMYVDHELGEQKLARLWPWHVAQTDLLVLGERARGLEAQAKKCTRGIEVTTAEDPHLEKRLRSMLCHKARPSTTPTNKAFVTSRREQPRLPSKPFVVVGAERTGSNMLVGLLESHAAIKSYGEIFNPRQIDHDKIDGALPASADRTRLLALRREDPGAFHRRVVELAAEEGFKFVGFKLLYYHGCISNSVIDHLTSVPELRVIHLKRKNRLARWISHQRARETDSWFKNKGDRSNGDAPGKITLSLDTTLRDFLQMELYEERADATFADLPMLEVYYEQLANDPRGECLRVLEFLGAGASELCVGTRKTGDRDPGNMVDNWEEIRPRLLRTRWGEWARPR